jgi:hypothetical protein
MEMNSQLRAAIIEAKSFSASEGGKWCVVERLDREGGVFEYAYVPVGVALDTNESIVWSMYDCQCNDLAIVVGASSPSEAANEAVKAFTEGRQYFASEAGAAGLSVFVDGVEHVPAAYAAEGQPSWDWDNN